MRAMLNIDFRLVAFCLAVFASTGCAITHHVKKALLIKPTAAAMVQQWPLTIGLYISPGFSIESANKKLLTQDPPSIYAVIESGPALKRHAFVGDEGKMDYACGSGVFKFRILIPSRMLRHISVCVHKLHSYP